MRRAPQQTATATEEVEAAAEEPEEDATVAADTPAEAENNLDPWHPAHRHRHPQEDATVESAWLRGPIRSTTTAT